MRAAALLAASLSSAAAAKIPDFASKPHIVMVREPRAAGLRSCLRFTARARPAARPALLTLGALVDPAQVVVDDLGWHNVGWHNPDMITPNADELVADGMTCAAALRRLHSLLRLCSRGGFSPPGRFSAASRHV